MLNDIYQVRRACTGDLDFICEVIISAEKSMTENLGLAKLFGLTESELRGYLTMMLEEEIDGCELSLSSFLVATYAGKPVASMAGWLEGYPDGDSSAILKANLISFILPKENILKAMDRQKVVRDLQIERQQGTYQLEYSYTDPYHRGKGLVNMIIETHLTYAKSLSPDCYKAQVHVFENNPVAIKMYEKSGFKIVRRYESSDPLTKTYFPYNVELLMEKNF